MSVHFICGKPGGGKSLYAMRLILDELLHGQRPIVTNMAINFSELWLHLVGAGYLNTLENVRRIAEGSAYDPDVHIRYDGPQHIRDRVLILDEVQLRRFFCFRGFDGKEDVEYVTTDEWKTGKRMSFTSLTHGVFYVLDEVHIAFPARDWANTGQQVLYYLSQHRKLGDDVLCVTQHLDNLDKQFRTMAQDFTWIRNLSKIKMGLFKMPGMFLRSTYVTDTENASPTETGTFRLNVSGIAKCYDTAAGIGVIGRSGADLGERRKGLHWSLFVVGLIGAVLFLLFGVPKVVLAVISRPFDAPAVAVPVTVSNAPGVNVERRLNSLVPQVQVSTNVFFVGSIGSEFLLSDGRVLTRYVERRGRGVVVMDEPGKFTEYRERPR